VTLGDALSERFELGESLGFGVSELLELAAVSPQGDREMPSSVTVECDHKQAGGVLESVRIGLAVHETPRIA
jgi:hypothetical protein